MYTSFENPQEFADQCRTLAQGPDDWLLVCLARNEEPKLDEPLASLSAQGYSIFGGVFPALVDGAEVRETGAVVKPVKLLAAPTIVQLDGNSIEPAALYPDISGAAARPTCLVFADFSCVAVTSLLEDLFDKYRSDVNYFGAGAGTGLAPPAPLSSRMQAATPAPLWSPSRTWEAKFDCGPAGPGIPSTSSRPARKAMS